MDAGLAEIKGMGGGRLRGCWDPGFLRPFSVSCPAGIDAAGVPAEYFMARSFRRHHAQWRSALSSGL